MADKRNFSVIVSLGNRRTLVRVRERKCWREIIIRCVCVRERGRGGGELSKNCEGKGCLWQGRSSAVIQYSLG